MSLFAAPETKPDPEVVGADGEDDNAPAVEEECAAEFTPVVHLEEVEVKTLEEDEDVLYVQRAKLFTYGETMLNKNTGVKTWNERGTGDVKLLKHRETSHIRVLMRQEKTMKIIVNHFLDPRIVLTPNAGATDKSWVWVAFDFSDGTELVETTFAIRFKTPEFAQEFQKSFLEGQDANKVLMSGADTSTTEEKKEADDVAEALDTLKVKGGDEEKDKEAAKEESTETADKTEADK